jgi:hypothetical protein
VYVMDGQLQPVPVGVAGELYIGGAGVGQGYLNRPELTAERFIANPFGEGGDTLYRTGDLVRYRPDGTLQFLERVDTQVKLRGYRIELGEIEAVLERHPLVRQAAVQVREDTPGDARLVAYVVGAGGETLEPAELRSHLQEYLPQYMVPGIFVSLAALPLTPNQKLNRKALPRPEAGTTNANELFAEPATELEQTIAGIWRELLGLERIGVYDNFFDLGGHSLLSMQFIAKLNRSAGIRVEPRDLIMQTLGQLAARYEGAASDDSAGSGLGGLTRRLFGSVRASASGRS